MKTYHLSTRQIIVSSALILIVGLAGIYFVGEKYGITTFSHVQPKTTSETIADAHVQAVVDKAEAAIAKAEASMAEPAPAPQAQSAPQTLPVTWTAADPKSPTPTIPLSDKVVDYEIVNLDPHPANLPGEGDQVVMPILKGQRVTVNVESITVNPNGDYTWTGHLQGQGTDYPVIMTYGEHSTFATIATPTGNYAMESVDGVGWLYRSPPMAAFADPNTTDYREALPR